MLRCLTGLCLRRQKKKKKHQTVSLAFVFWVREYAVLRQAENLCMYAGCRYVGEFIFFQLSLITSRLWSNSQWKDGGGGGAKQKSQQVHIATRTHKNCDLHNLFFKPLKCKEMRRSPGARQTRPPAWQPQLNTLSLHICSQLQLEARQHESL